MVLTKKIKDQLIKLLLGKSTVPHGLIELNQYFRHYEPIEFRREKAEDGSIIAISNNFRYGAIITSGKNLEELDKKIKDAILTCFEIPSSYAKEAAITRGSGEHEMYALA